MICECGNWTISNTICDFTQYRNNSNCSTILEGNDYGIIIFLIFVIIFIIYIIKKEIQLSNQRGKKE